MSLTKGDMVNIVALSIVIVFWSFGVVPYFDDTSLSPLHGYLVYNLMFFLAAVYLGSRVKLEKQVVGWFAVVTAWDILTFPFCPLWSSEAIPSSQSIGADCALRQVLLDSFGLSSALSYNIIYSVVPILLIILGFSLMVNRAGVFFNFKKKK